MISKVTWHLANLLKHAAYMHSTLTDVLQSGKRMTAINILAGSKNASWTT